MSAYRFCRTDDIGLLVDALNRCWGPHFPDAPPSTPASFKRSIRDLQVWCSSCMVAFAGAAPIGVLIGAKRSSATLIHRIAVHPDHMRQGHGRHLLASLSSKLAILGPPRIVAEIPASFTAARALFRASGYLEEAVFTDYTWDPHHVASPLQRADRTGLVIPFSVDDLAANGLLEAGDGLAWARSAETLTARKLEIEGWAVASDERIEAAALYIKEAGELVALQVAGNTGEAFLPQLLAHLRAAGVGRLRFSKAHPSEASPAILEPLGFVRGGGHVLYAARPRSD